MIRFRTFFALTTTGLLIFSGLMATAPVYADAATNDVCTGISSVGDNTTQNCSDNGTLSKVVQTAVEVLSTIVGVAAVIVIVIAGFRYVLSAGDSNSASSARSAIIYALIGLVIAIMAQLIVRFVIAKTNTPPSGTSSISTT